MKFMGAQTLGSCCGHGKYPKTLIVRNCNGNIVESLSGTIIPRTKHLFVCNTSYTLIEISVLIGLESFFIETFSYRMIIIPKL